MDRNGPRYTSYPTADRFVESFDEAAYRTWAGKRSVGGKLRPLSIYVHIPFCNTICFYCGCNKVVTMIGTMDTKIMRLSIRNLPMRSASPPTQREVNKVASPPQR